MSLFLSRRVTEHHLTDEPKEMIPKRLATRTINQYQHNNEGDQGRFRLLFCFCPYQIKTDFKKFAYIDTNSCGFPAKSKMIQELKNDKYRNHENNVRCNYKDFIKLSLTK